LNVRFPRLGVRAVHDQRLIADAFPWARRVVFGFGDGFLWLAVVDSTALGKSVWAECPFVDPISDIAVLGRPDEMFDDEAKAYDQLVEAESVTQLSVAPPDRDGWLLSLDGVWFRCVILPENCGRIRLASGEGKIVSEMSGSPVLSSLIGNLPGWFFGR
jgi:hypothetical protein